MNKSSKKRGFTLVEIICVVVLLGLFGGIGVALMRDTSDTGRDRALAANVDELNRIMNSMRAAGVVFQSGMPAFTDGSQTTAAVLTFPPTAMPGHISTLVTYLSSTGSNGVTSYGIGFKLSRSITASSYTYTLGADNVPIWTTTSGTNLAP